MAVTVSLYNHTADKFASGDFTASDTYKVALLDDTGTFDATDTVWGDVSADEVSGNGWTAGGETLTSLTITTTTTNDATLDAADISVTASGGAIGPAENAVLYCDTSTSPADGLVLHIAFGEAKTADSGTDFKITWDTNGIITWTVT